MRENCFSWSNSSLIPLGSPGSRHCQARTVVDGGVEVSQFLGSSLGQVLHSKLRCLVVYRLEHPSVMQERRLWWFFPPWLNCWNTLTVSWISLSTPNTITMSLAIMSWAWSSLIDLKCRYRHSSQWRQSHWATHCLSNCTSETLGVIHVHGDERSLSPQPGNLWYYATCETFIVLQVTDSHIEAFSGQSERNGFSHSKYTFGTKATLVIFVVCYVMWGLSSVLWRDYQFK